MNFLNLYENLVFKDSIFTALRQSNGLYRHVGGMG